MSIRNSKQSLYTIILVLSVSIFSLGAYNSYRFGTTEFQARTLLKQSTRIYFAMHQHKKEKGAYPTDLASLVSHGYLVKIPDPGNIADAPYILIPPHTDVVISGMSEGVCKKTQQLSEKKPGRLIRTKCVQPNPERDFFTLVFSDSGADSLFLW